MKSTSRNRPFSADYTYTVEGNIIAIEDLDLGNRSVTNDIEFVLADIQAKLGTLAGYQIIYRDSMGRWDGIRLVDNTVHFYGLGESEKEQAMNRLLHPLG
ncbi:hypothetical protein [Spirosoma fluminis]